MSSLAGIVAAFLNAVLTLFGFAQIQPVVPQQQAQEVAQQALTQATETLKSTSTDRSNLPDTPVSSFSTTTPSGFRVDVKVTYCYNMICIGTHRGLDPHLESRDGIEIADLPSKNDVINLMVTTKDNLPGEVFDVVIDLHKSCTDADCLNLADSDIRSVETYFRNEIFSGGILINPNNTSSISVPGMSKYTDADFGFSFWYPSGWTVTKSTNKIENYSGDSFMGSLALSNGTQTIFVSKYTSQAGIHIVGGKVFDRIYFDKMRHEWMYDRGWSPTEGMGHHIDPADVSDNTMGGLHIIGGSVVPLSASNFVVIDSESTNDPVKNLTRTIVATDPEVATSVSTAEQIKTIQVEAQAFDVSSSNVESTKIFSSPSAHIKFSYQSDFTASNDITEPQKNRTSSYLSVTCDNDAACLYYTGSDITDIQAASFAVKTSVTPTYEQCLKVVQKSTESVEINGVTWLKDATGDAGLGNRLSTDRYRAYYNDACYQAELSTGWSVGTNNSSLKTLDTKMQAILKTVQFTLSPTNEAKHSSTIPAWSTLVGSKIPISFKYPGSFIVEQNDVNGIGVVRGSYIGVGWLPDDDYGGQITIQPDPMFSSVDDAAQRSQYRSKNGSNGSPVSIGGQPAYQFKDSNGTMALYIEIAGKLYQITMFGQIISPAVPNEWETFISSFKFTQ